MQKKASRSLESIFRVIRDGEDAASVRAAIMDLGYETHKDIYPLLVKHLDDPNPGIQHAAVLSLGRLGRPEAIKELVKPKIFRSPASNIRWAAVSAVGRLGDYRVIDHLLKAVEDPEWIVRTQAVTELKSKVQDIIGLKDVRLARILIHMLSLENDEIVELAIDGFQEIGMESLHHLHEALNNSSATIRANAARALGKLKACQSTPFLLAALQDDDWQVRASAAEALGAVGDNACLEALVQKIQDNVEKVQEAAANAIVNFGNQATAPLLNALARERDKFAQRAFIKCLGKIGDPKCVPALIAYLRSSYFLVRQAAVSTLMRFGPSIAPLLLPVLSFNRSDI
ncbi:MAG TPA: HEAT repeat domain-containing protein, partial [Candidatus Aminicenantes bacterium]|nr:HEAT repeat domain-containing protein [Candidatus Aminicenantes bacterium]